MWSILKALNELIKALNANSRSALVVASDVQETNFLLRLISRQLRELIDRLRNLPDPGPISLLVTSEKNDMLQFKITLPAEPPEPNDITGGELTVTIASNPPAVIPTPKGATEVAALADGTPLQGNQGDAVSATFVYLDDATPPNRSVHASAINGVELTDTIPPADPGQLGLAVTGES